METDSAPHSQAQNSRNSPAAAAPPRAISSEARLWRPAAQRNLKNQWMKLASLRQDWRSAAASGRSHATSIVNSYLSQKYMDGMDFGVLSDMPNIQKKARWKLFKQQILVTFFSGTPIFTSSKPQKLQELYRGKLLSSYKEMVAIVTQMVTACKSMRCYFKGTKTSPFAQFSFSSEDDGDSGDCGGVPVFTSWSIASFEEEAWEIVRMFISELNLKRLLVMEFLSICDEKTAAINGFHWSDEFYSGEFNDLSNLNLYSKETRQPILPCLQNCRSSTSTIQNKQQQDSNVLEVYVTTWMVEVNVDRGRMDDILAVVGGEIHVNFLETSG